MRFSIYIFLIFNFLQGYGFAFLQKPTNIVSETIFCEGTSQITVSGPNNFKIDDPKYHFDEILIELAVVKDKNGKLYTEISEHQTISPYRLQIVNTSSGWLREMDYVGHWLLSWVDAPNYNMKYDSSGKILKVYSKLKDAESERDVLYSLIEYKMTISFNTGMMTQLVRYKRISNFILNQSGFIALNKIDYRLKRRRTADFQLSYYIDEGVRYKIDKDGENCGNVLGNLFSWF